MQFLKYRGDMVMKTCASYKPGGRVLYSLENRFTGVTFYANCTCFAVLEQYGINSTKKGI